MMTQISAFVLGGILFGIYIVVMMFRLLVVLLLSVKFPKRVKANPFRPLVGLKPWQLSSILKTK